MAVMTTTPARAFAFLARGGASRAPTVAVRAVGARAPSHRRIPIPGDGPPPSALARAVPRAPAALFSRGYARSPPSLRLASLRLRASSDDGAVDAAPAAAADAKRPATHQLITFFCFTQVPDYEAEVAEHRAFVEENGLELRGRIYINQQGINAQMSGKGTDGERYARWVESRPHFNGMRISVYPTHEQAHPKLSLRYKPQLVQLEGGTAHLPVHDPSRRGIPLNPSQWHDMLGDVIDEKPDAPVLLDVRNGYEWDVGHFRGAERPVQESFRETVETNVEEGSGPLAGVDKSRPIMMYCTGGIRCDVYSTVLREQGYDKVYTLEGGVQAYFDEFGEREDQRWDDQLFVFDSRLAMTPRGTPAAEAGEEAATLRCHCCEQPRAPPPHRNCPNVDCNRLFLVCPGCLSKLGGFCCAECGKASHVRPTLLQPGRYQRYAHYTEGEAMLRAERRGEGRRERRRRRRERKKLEAARDAADAVAAGQRPRDLLRAVRVLEKAAANPEAFQGKGPDSGTLAARTRSIVRAAGLVDPDDSLDDAEEATRGAVGGGGDSRYARQRARLREAAEAIASGRVPGMDLRALADLDAEVDAEVDAR